MKIITFSAGIFYTNIYILVDEATGKYAVIDPGDKTDELYDTCEDLGFDNLEYIMLTHGHFDHIYGVDALMEKCSAKLVISGDDAEMLLDTRKNASWLVGAEITCESKPDILVSDGDMIHLGELEINVISTPGHSKGSVCYICDNVIFAGDTVFCCGNGRTDLYSGSEKELHESFGKIAELEGDYNIYCGHDIPTTLSYEREHNPNLRMR